LAEDRAGKVVAQPPAGRRRGTRDGSALRFLGIPYAQPPAVTGRFAAPVPPAGWDGIRDALAYGASSAQPDRGVTFIPEPVIPGENELNLNIFTPELGAAGLPVLVWIHGGGYTGGSNASPWYRGGAFARDGVVLVSINYRLGAPGFLEVPDAPANRAVRDWVRALEWVAENIAAFGGDPAKVTIAGQSAGGGACAALTGVPAADGLFRGLICMSGGTELQQTPAGVRAVASQFSEHLGVPLSRAALAELSPQALLAAQAALTGPAGTPDPEAVLGRLAAARLLWAPWVDGELVTASPWQAARAAGHRHVPLLAGATAQEMTAGGAAHDWLTPGLVRAALARAGVVEPQLDRYLDQYAGLRPGEVFGQAVTDRTFRVPAQELAAAKAAAGGAAYVYDFRWGPPAGPFAGRPVHCLDVPFVFGTLAEPGVTDVAGDAPPQQLARDMHGAWVRFVTGGDPGWGRYAAADRQVMVFDEVSAVQDDPLRLERETWSAVITPGT
jgi:para-nitrobenzyl esterase